VTRALVAVLLAACATPAAPPPPIGSRATPVPSLPGLVRGRVLDEAGRPVANAIVSTDRPPAPQEHATRTGEDGAFALRFGEPWLSNGFELHAWIDQRVASMPVGIPRNAKAHVVTITVHPVGSVRGTILGARTFVLAAERDDGGYFRGPVDADGTFRIVNVPVGRYLVGDADAPSNFEPVEVTTGGDASVTVTR